MAKVQIINLLNAIKGIDNQGQLLALVAADSSTAFVGLVQTNKLLGLTNYWGAPYNNLINELEEDSNRDELGILQREAAQVLINLHLGSLSSITDITELNTIAEARDNAALFSILEKHDNFLNASLNSKNFPENFYGSVIAQAKQKADRVLQDAAAPLIAVVRNDAYINSLIRLCDRLQDDVALEQKIREHLSDIPEGFTPVYTAPATLLGALGNKLITNLPSQKVEEVVQQVKDAIIAARVANARAAKTTAVDIMVPAIQVPTQNGTDHTHVTVHENYINQLSIQDCIARIQTLIGPDLAPDTAVTPPNHTSTLKNDLAYAKSQLGQKTASDYKKAKERVQIHQQYASLGLGNHRIPNIVAEQQTIRQYEAYQKAQRKLYLANEQLERVERQLSLVNAADQKLDNFETIDDKLKLIVKQEQVVAEAQVCAQDAAKKLVRYTLEQAATVDDAHRANTGYVVRPRAVLKTTTCKLADVRDLRGEAQVKIDSLLANAPSVVLNPGPETAIEGGVPVFYQNMRLESGEHKLTTAYLNKNKGVLLLAQDSKGTIRDLSTASNMPIEPAPLERGAREEDIAKYRDERLKYDNELTQYKEDLLNKALTHAQERLDTFTGGVIHIMTPEGASHDAGAANRLYAALLLVAESRGIKNMEIKSWVGGHDVPEDHWSGFGKDNAKFIRDYLGPVGYTPRSLKDRLFQDKSEYALFLKGVKPEDKPMHGDVTESPKPK